MQKNTYLFSDMLAGLADSKGDSLALVYKDEEYTYGEFHRAVELCAADLVKMGVEPGDHVALWSLNSANWLITFFGIIRAGGVAVLANYGMPPAELAKLLAFTDVKYIACGAVPALAKDPEAAGKLAEAAGVGPDKLYDIRHGSMDYRKRLAGGELPGPLPEEDRNSRRTAIIIFTSGTTGMPKAVEQSQSAVLHNAEWLIKIQRNNVGERFLLALPLFHSYGLEIAVCYCSLGRTLYITDALAPDILVNMIIENEITDLFSVSVLYFGIVSHPLFEEAAGLPRFCGVGGSFSTPVQLMRLAMLFPNAAFFCGYGQTETCTVITVPSPDAGIETCANTVGRPLEGLDVRIFDARQGFLPDGKTGEVLVRGDSLMNGYYKLPPEQQAIDAEGWLHTGDLGYFDEDGNLRLAGRIKDIIIKNGENVSPSEIEARITECGGVREVKVLGAPHPLFGESIEACIVMQRGVEFDEAALREQLKSRLSSFKTPSHFFVYEGLPLNASGKIDLRTLQSDMFDRLKTLAIQEALHAGVCAAQVTVKNTSYNVVPVASMVENLMEAIGFGRKDKRRIRLAAEEMLIERITNAFADVGDINLQVLLFRDWVTLRFTDGGTPYSIEKDSASSYSAMIILKMVDSYQRGHAEDGKPVYWFSFLYDKDFDVNNFMKEHSRAAANMLGK